MLRPRTVASVLLVGLLVAGCSTGGSGHEAGHTTLGSTAGRTTATGHTSPPTTTPVGTAGCRAAASTDRGDGVRVLAAGGTMHTYRVTAPTGAAG
ncbi:MAG TPA: hypothetical protein VGM93_08265, partial [Acidimicrobiales bacterium]